MQQKRTALEKEPNNKLRTLRICTSDVFTLLQSYNFINIAES